MRSLPMLSVVVPARDEAENLRELVEEIERALAGLEFEIVIVDDRSEDATRATLRALLARHPRLRAVALTGSGGGSGGGSGSGGGGGQSAAFHAGFRVARGELIAGLDADGQNDPAEIPRMLAEMREGRADLIQGDRTDARCDSLARRVESSVGRAVRRLLLGDRIRDTGCSLRIMKREVALRLPLEYRGMHRFIPFTARSLGYRVVETPVGHHPRRAGRTKYGAWNRALPGLIDCFAVRWMRRRRRSVSCVEIDRISDTGGTNGRDAPAAVRIEIDAALQAAPEKATS